MMIRIGIIGYGVVGENTGLLFADIPDPKQIKILKYDKYKTGRWNTIKEISSCDFIFICLPTPMGDHGRIDLTYIDGALEEINSFCRGNRPIVIIRSTSVSGSSDIYAQKYKAFEIAFVPEFLTEKNPWNDTKNATRLVIGANSISVFFAIKSLFQIYYQDRIHYIHLTREEAEMYKYACNYLLSMSVLSANELYFICQSVGIDYQKIQENLKHDKRIGSFTQVPGHDGDFGIGGKCFPKDISALYALAKENDYNAEFLKTAIDFNLKIRKRHDWLDIAGAISGNKYNPENIE